MTPAEKAKAVCERAGGNFREIVEAHMMHGFLFSTPELFLATRPVPSCGDISDLQASWPREECDAWFVWAGVGDWAALLRLMPYELPLVGWYRAGRGWRDCHWVPVNLLRRFESALAPGRFPCYSRIPHGRRT
jgi:hypothetical protein